MYSIVANYFYTLRMFSHDVRMYLITATLLGFSYFGIIAVLLNLYLLRLGYGPEFIGLVNGATSSAFALTSLLAGAIGRRWGNRRSVVAGMSLMVITVTLLPITELFPDQWQEPGILLMRFLNGFGFALYIVNANPHMIAATKPQERNHAFSMQVALLPLAGFVGGLVGGVLPSFFAGQLGLTLEQAGPYRYPLFIAGLAMLPAVWALQTTTEPPIATTESIDIPTPNKAATSGARGYGATPMILILFLAVSASFRMAGEGASRSFFNVYLDTGLGVSTAQIGVLVAVGQLLAVPAALAAPFLIARQGKVPVVVFATLGISASLMIMAFLPHWLAAGIGFMGVTAMLSVTRAVTNIYQMEAVTAEWRSLTSGTVSMAMGIGFSSMTLGGGYIIRAIGYQGFFSIGAISVMCSALIFWAYFRTPRGEYAVGVV